MSNLFNTFTLSNGITIKNRLVKAAMSEQLTMNNQPNHYYENLYRTWANGGAGILVTGNVMVDYTALGGEGDVVIEDERDLEMLQRWAKAGTENNTILLMQLNHPGKQSPKDLSPEPVAPSAIPLAQHLLDFFAPPRALTELEIKNIIDKFANASVIAEKAGFSGVQIHAAHGYLLSQFLSPHHNQRNDQWGGSVENRARILVEIYQAIRTSVSKTFIVAIKLNSADFQKGGFSEEESMQVIKLLSDLGVDLIEISGGNYEHPAMLNGVKESTKKREAYFLDYAEKVRKITAIPLIVTGGFRSQAAMESALQSNQLDFVGIAKPFAIEPNFPNQLFQNSYKTISLKPIRTGIRKLDYKLGSVLEMAWFMVQMKRIAKSKKAKPNLSVWRVFFNILLQKGLKGFRKERV